MGTEVQSKAAAWARAAQLAQMACQNLNSPDILKEDQDCCPIAVDLDSKDDCGYTGGVNAAVLESDKEPDTNLSEEWSDGDDENLAEMEGNDLAANLYSLKAKADTFEVPSCNQKHQKHGRRWRQTVHLDTLIIQHT